MPSRMWHKVAVQIDTDVSQVHDFSGMRTEWTLNVEGEFPPERWYTHFIRWMELRISPKNSTGRQRSRYHCGFGSRQEARGFCLLQQVQTSGAHLTPCLLDTRIGFHGGKEADTYIWHLPSSSVEDKNEWRYTATAPIRFHFEDRENFTLLHSNIGDRGSTVVKVLCYKSKGRWFDPSLHEILPIALWLWGRLSL